MPEPRTNHGLAESTYRQAKHMQAAGTTPQLMAVRLFIPVAVATAILAEPVNSDLGGIERLAVDLDAITYGPGWPD